MASYKSVNYFKPLTNEGISILSKAIMDSKIELAYAGIGSFPPKWGGSELELTELLVAQAEGTGIVKFEDAMNHIDIEFSFARDCSLISVVSPNKETSKELCRHFNNYVASFANVVSEITEKGALKWEIFFVSDNCPAFLKEVLGQ